jgi:sulfide:quinone oxidoreductase
MTMAHTKRTRIVVLGGSFGGLTVAHELRRLLPREQREITLISRDGSFVFIPSLPWVAMGHQTLRDISFDLGSSLTSKGIEFVRGEAERVDTQACAVTVDSKEIDYDILVVATGHRSANEALPGLGPFDGPGHSLMSPPESEEASDAWQHFLDDPGPMVIGCAAGASCLGPAYEFAFEADHALRRRNTRHLVPISFVTPEPELGHFGVGGFGRARQFLEGEFEERDIRYHTSVAVSKITDTSVELAGGEVFESRYSMIIPPLAGARVITASPGLGNPKGFVPVDDGYRHTEFDNVYAVGVTVATSPVDQPPVPVNFPKTGHMTVQMGKAAARNIAADIRGGEHAAARPLSVRCVMDLGDRAVYMMADPVRPPRNRVSMSVGRRWLWAKRAYAKYFLSNMKSGRTWLP